MAYSNQIGTRVVSALDIIDHVFRRCRLPAQAITSEMQAYALQCVFTFLSSLANPKPPSWCIDKKLLPMYQNQPVVGLPTGTIEVLNLNYRTIQQISGAIATTGVSYTSDFGSPTVISTVGIRWSGTPTNSVIETSQDNVSWTQVGLLGSAIAGDIEWVDISGPLASRYIRVVGAGTLNYAWIVFGNTPIEIPLGVLNMDDYVNQSNKVYPSRPNSFWFQRNLANPVINLWPAPFDQAEKAQLVLYRHREIMDTQNLRQQIEIPNRWFEAVIFGVATLVAMETPAVPLEIVNRLEMSASTALQQARDGDSNGSSTFINPGIGVYTK